MQGGTHAQGRAVDFPVPGVELGHHGREWCFEAILKKYKLNNTPALQLLGKIVNGADADNTLWHQSEAPGLKAAAEGFRHLRFSNDHGINAAEWIVYDALYAHCREMVKQGKGSRRVERDLRSGIVKLWM